MESFRCGKCRRARNLDSFDLDAGGNYQRTLCECLVSPIVNSRGIAIFQI